MDERVTAAISNWSPRFIANGIDHSDFLRVTATIERWDQWCAAWCDAGAEHEELGRTALADGRGRSGGTHLAQAAAYYHFAKFVFVQDPAQMRAAHERAVRCLIWIRLASGWSSRSTAPRWSATCAVPAVPARIPW